MFPFPHEPWKNPWLVGWFIEPVSWWWKRPWAPGLEICVSTSRLMNLLLDDERKVDPASRKQLDPIHVPKGLNSTFVFLWIRDKLINLLIVGAPIYPRIPLEKVGWPSPIHGVDGPSYISKSDWSKNSAQEILSNLAWVEWNWAACFLPQQYPWRIHVLGIFTYIYVK